MIDYDIWFCSLNINYKAKFYLLDEYSCPENIWNSYINGHIENKKINDVLKDSWDKEKIETIKSKIFQDNIQVINYNDKLYPEKLRAYEDSPYVLFCKGDIRALNGGTNVSIVGSRKCTNYGKDVTKIISSELSKNNINIVSGMASGIDTCAHMACIENNGYTCAVLGCGIDIIYPKENEKLYNNIIESGCIISEFLPGTPPLNYNFPTRNRIISALSEIVIVVEAGIKSGSLITAGLALEKGKDVMAVPGSIFSEQSKGSNKLIRDGAYPVTCMEDIFRLLHINYTTNGMRKSVSLNRMQQKLYSILSDNPIHIDDILKATNIDINHLYELLFELQLKDEIMCLAGNYYVKVNKSI